MCLQIIGFFCFVMQILYLKTYSYMYVYSKNCIHTVYLYVALINDMHTIYTLNM